MRMFLIMLVSLYTSRIVLNALGVEDFGVYNVVGGVVTMFGIITGTISTATGRFFMIELGRGDFKKLNEYFRLALIVFFGFALIIFLLAESLGLWFLNVKLVIPASRMFAAHWVYQCSVIAFLLQMMLMPYNSIVIAHEKMNIYALLSIIEVILKLVIVFILQITAYDKLIIYAVLQLFITFSSFMFYYMYCKRKFPETKFSLFWDRKMFMEMGGFSIWTIFGSIATVAREQGINFLLNIFFNPIVNAARAIAYLVSGAINNFTNNFYTAVKPQIMKRYGEGNIDSMMSLVFSSSRLCYYLFMVLSLPVLIDISYILEIWLKTAPVITVLFTRLVIIIALIDTISYPIMAAVHATGKIKFYQIVAGGLLILNLPISYVFLKFNYPPEITMYVAVAISIVTLIARVIFMKTLLNMSLRKFTLDVIARIIAVTFVAYSFAYFIYGIFEVGFIRLIVFSTISIIFSLLLVYAIGISRNERKMTNSFIGITFKKTFLKDNS